MIDISGRSAVLLDQHPLWLDAIERVVTALGLEVAGKTTSPAAAVALVDKVQPDLFVLGIEANNGDMDGLSCLHEARSRAPHLQAIALSATADREKIDAAFAAGAFAYVVKTAHPDDLASAIRQAFEHSIYLSGSQGAPSLEAPQPLVDGLGLTRRELEILRLVADGHSNAHLARMLWVTEQTVKFHLSNIYRKLDVSNRTEASRWAQRHGLLSDQPDENESAYTAPSLALAAATGRAG
jgi:two-component system response regulator DevR